MLSKRYESSQADSTIWPHVSFRTYGSPAALDIH